MKKILILHGWTYSTDKWKKLIMELKALDYDIEILKIPGLTLKSESVWDLDKYVEWLHKKVSKEKNKVILLGHSNGGRIAAAYTAKFSNNISSLILVDSAGVYHKELFLQVKRLLFNVAAKVGKKITRSDTLKKMLYKMAREKDYYNAPESTKKTMINLVQSDITDSLSKIKVPVLIIWGKLDKVTPVSDAFIFRDSIKNSKLVIINEARHSPFFTHTTKVIEIIKNGI